MRYLRRSKINKKSTRFIIFGLISHNCFLDFMKTVDQILDELEEDEEYDRSYCDIDTLLRMSFDDLEYSFIFSLLVCLSMTNI